MGRSAGDHAAGHARIELRLPAIGALFDPPDLTPFSSEFHPYSYASGMEYLADRLYADRRLKTVEATIALPSDELESISHEEVRAAIRRYTAAKIEATDIHVRADTTRGGRAMLLGFGVLAILLLITGRFEDVAGDSFIAETIITGLWIGAWVAFWFPLDKLLWGVWTHRNDRLVYERLSDMHFTLVADEDRH